MGVGEGALVAVPVGVSVSMVGVGCAGVVFKVTDGSIGSETA